MSKSQVVAPPEWTPAEIEACRDMLTRSFLRLIAECELSLFDTEHLRCIVDRAKRFPTLCSAPEIAPWLVKNRSMLIRAATGGTSPER